MILQIKKEQAESLKTLAKENDTFSTVLFNLAIRERSSKATDLGLFRLRMINAGFEVDPNQYRTFWEKMQALNFGSIEYPREEGKAMRFNWNYSLKAVGRVVHAPETLPKAPKEAKYVAPVKAKKRRQGRPKGSKNKAPIPPKTTHIAIFSKDGVKSITLNRKQAKALQEVLKSA